MRERRLSRTSRELDIACAGDGARTHPNAAGSGVLRPEIHTKWGTKYDDKAPLQTNLYCMLLDIVLFAIILVANEKNMKKNSAEAAVEAYEMPFHRRPQPVCCTTNQSVLAA